MQHDLKQALIQQRVRVNDGSAAALVRLPTRLPTLRAQRDVQIGPRPVHRKTGNPIAKVIAALVIGMLAVIIARYLRFQVSGSMLFGSNVALTMILDTALALAVSLMAKTAFHLNFAFAKLTIVAGIILMISVMHNVVHLVPGPFGVMFSTAWVNQVVTYTEPNSILLYGTGFTLNSDPKPILALPGQITVHTLDG